MATILDVQDLYKTFKQNFKAIKVLKGVDIQVDEGEIYGFLGQNGSGKTTTLKCILGFLKPDQGNITLFDQQLTNKDLYKKIGYSPENTFFYDHLTGIEFLVFMGRLTGMKKQEAELVGIQLMDKLGLQFAYDRFVKSYSKGMKQRLGLAASLMNNPEMIFWDEPMSGLDPMGRALVKDLMVELKNQGKTLFFNTHILSDVEEIADRFGIIHDGVIVHEDSTKNLDKSLEALFREVVQQQTTKLNVK